MKEQATLNMETDAKPSPTRDTSCKVTMTLPLPVFASLEAQGTPLAMTAGEWLKHLVIAAYTQRDGIALKLQPVTMPEDLAQLKLPLGGFDPKA